MLLRIKTRLHTQLRSVPRIYQLAGRLSRRAGVNAPLISRQMKRSNVMSRTTIVITALVLIAPVAAFFLIKRTTFDGNVTIGETLSQNGFVEIKPPSTLVPPGTWVTVLNPTPLHLSIICTPQNSLGLVDAIPLCKSVSADAQMLSKLNGSFELESSGLADVKGNAKFREVKTISFQLKNIRVVELPDEVVMQGLQNRVPHCREAIKFRVDNKQQVSMVKAVLIADVDYRVEFNRKLDSATEADLKKQLALEMDFRLGTGENGSTSIIGRDLIWGIREDPRLARVGLGLPATGGTPISPALAGKGAVTQISQVESKRREFTKEQTVVAHPVLPLRQSSAMSCWATVYAMMKSWRDESALSVKSVVSDLGTPWDDYYVKDTGLPGGKEKEFVEAVGMETKPPANYTLQAYVDMLREHGPLWIIMGDGISSHALVLVGIYGKYETADKEAYEKTTVEFIDPLTGTYHYESALEFAHKFESEPRWLVDRHLDDITLRDQILYWPRPSH